MSAFSVENPQDGKTFEKYSRFEWGVEVDVVTTFMLRLFVPHEFDMNNRRTYIDVNRGCCLITVMLKIFGAIRSRDLIPQGLPKVSRPITQTCSLREFLRVCTIKAI